MLNTQWWERTIEIIIIILHTAELADNTRKRKAKVVFNYTAENPDELSLPLESTVEILGEEEEGWWWRGKLDGKEGVFPSNFVQLIEETEERDTSPDFSSITPSK